MFNLLCTLPWRKPSLPIVAAHLALPPADQEPASPCGCGWFDSSHELQQGLCVLEHASADAVSCDMPLAHWLDLQLGGWQGSLAS